MLIKSNGKALRRPVLSPNGKTLAFIAPDERIHLLDLSEAAQGREFINGLKVTRSIRPFLHTCTMLRWSPEEIFPLNDEALEIRSQTTSECDLGISWLLLSDGRRVIALSPDLRSPKMMPRIHENSEEAPSNVLADYNLGEHLGKIKLLEFVFDHRHALAIFEFGSSATVLSLTRPVRDDITCIKYPDTRSFAPAPDSRYFSLLRREKGQDKLSVFHLDNDQQPAHKLFDCNTFDAQNISWCPNGRPLIAVCESPAFGVKVLFYTAEGHHLQRFDINYTIFYQPRNHIFAEPPEGVGLTYWNWERADAGKDMTVQVLANGEKQVSIHYRNTTSMETRPCASIVHPDVIDAARTSIWVETIITTKDKTINFMKQTGVFDSTRIPSTNSKEETKPTPAAQTQNPHQIDQVKLNCNNTMVATHILSTPQTLFLWKTSDTAYPDAVLIFKHTIREIRFHPYLPHVLAVLTGTRSPRVYMWYDHNSPPIAGVIPIDTSSSTSFSFSWLPQCIGKGVHQDAARKTDEMSRRCPFLLTSNAAFEAGYLSIKDEQIIFDTIINRWGQQEAEPTLYVADDESTIEPLDTPSKASRHDARRGKSDNVKKARFDVTEVEEKDDQVDPIHEQAKYAYAW